MGAAFAMAVLLRTCSFSIIGRLSVSALSKQSVWLLGGGGRWHGIGAIGRLIVLVDTKILDDSAGAGSGQMYSYHAIRPLALGIWYCEFRPLAP